MPATIILGVGAGIAAYKSALILRQLSKAGHDIHVIPTPDSQHFIEQATWAGLSGNPVHTDVFSTGLADHIELARHADLIVIAPATADLLARLRAGMANDLLTTTVLAATCPIVLAPAMHSQMWTNPATVDNISHLRGRGFHIIDPDTGPLGSGDFGVGRLPEPDVISAFALSVLEDSQKAAPADLAGYHFLISAGGTREAIDPVRFIGNESSGRQGTALAVAAAQRGANVTLVAANISRDIFDDEGATDAGIEIVSATSAAEVEKAILSRLDSTDVLIMAAAIADFRPALVQREKIKKDPGSTDAPTISLERTTDILATAAAAPNRPSIVVGFAAETGDLATVRRLGGEKARRKGADFLVINRVGDGHGFGNVPNEVFIVDHNGRDIAQAIGTKAEVAVRVLDQVAAKLASMAG
ncbi:MAG: bifunctional phosphopantothenoylcysteine decarboxylase/phosphopantothenate--cysteine ligase CoaBC [Actinomycetaceae bacterium]|nr:bifunctional phosphopantothenoylcysteine decarboxylase/phosphopantothenate--cysteine ligase CoaBC [Actinomycetaceae bacterium]